MGGVLGLDPHPPDRCAWHVLERTLQWLRNARRSGAGAVVGTRPAGSRGIQYGGFSTGFGTGGSAGMPPGR